MKVNKKLVSSIVKTVGLGLAVGGAICAKKKYDVVVSERDDLVEELEEVKSIRDIAFRLNDDAIDYLDYAEWQMIQEYRQEQSRSYNDGDDSVQNNYVC